MSAMESNILHNPIKFSIKTNDLEKLKKKPDKLFDKIDNSDNVNQETIAKEVISKKGGFTNLGFKIKDALIRRHSTCSEVPLEECKVPSKRQHEPESELVSSKQRKIEEDQVIIEPETSSTLVIKALPRSAMSPIVIEENSILKIFSKCKDVITDKLDEKIDAIDRICQSTSFEVSVGNTDNDININKEELSKKRSSRNAYDKPSEKKSIAKDMKTNSKSFKEEKIVQTPEKNIKSEETAVTMMDKDKRRDKKDSHKIEIDNKSERKLKETTDVTKCNRKVSPVTHRVSKQDGKSNSNVENVTSTAPRPSSYRRSNTERQRKSPQKRDDTAHRHRSRSKGKDHSKKSSSNTRTHKDSSRESQRSLKGGTFSLRDEFMMATRCGVVNPEDELEETFSHKAFKAPMKDKRHIAEKLQKLFSKTKSFEEKQSIDIQPLSISEGQKEEIIIEEAKILIDSSTSNKIPSKETSITDIVVTKDHSTRHKKGLSNHPETTDKYHKSTHKVKSTTSSISPAASSNTFSTENNVSTLANVSILSVPAEIISHQVPEPAVIFPEIIGCNRTKSDKPPNSFSEDKQITSQISSIKDCPITTLSSHIDYDQKSTLTSITHVTNDLKQSQFQGAVEQYNVTKMMEKTIIMEPLMKTCNIFFRIKSNAVAETLSNNSSKKDEESIVEDISVSVIDLKTPYNTEVARLGHPATTLFSVLDRYLDQSSSAESSLALNAVHSVDHKTESQLSNVCKYEGTMDNLNAGSKFESRGIKDREVQSELSKESINLPKDSKNLKGIINNPNDSVNPIKKENASKSVVECVSMLEDELKDSIPIPISKEESNHSIRLEWFKDESKLSFKSKQNREWESWKMDSKHLREREQLKDKQKYSKDNENKTTSISSKVSELRNDEAKHSIKLLDGSECVEEKGNVIVELIGPKFIEQKNLSKDQFTPTHTSKKDSEELIDCSKDSHAEFLNSTIWQENEKNPEICCSLVIENVSRDVICDTPEGNSKHVEVNISSVDEKMSEKENEETLARKTKGTEISKSSFYEQKSKSKYQDTFTPKFKDVVVQKSSTSDEKSDDKCREKIPEDVERSKDRHRKQLEHLSKDIVGEKNSINEVTSKEKDREKSTIKSTDAEVKKTPVDEVMSNKKDGEKIAQKCKNVEMKKSITSEVKSKEEVEEKVTRRSKEMETKTSSTIEVTRKEKDRDKSIRKSKDVVVKTSSRDRAISDDKDREKLLQKCKDVEIKKSSTAGAPSKEKDQDTSTRKSKDLEVNTMVINEDTPKEMLNQISKDLNVSKNTINDKTSKDKSREKLPKKPQDLEVKMSSCNQEETNEKCPENLTQESKDDEVKKNLINEGISKAKNRDKLEQKSTDVELKKSAIDEEISESKGRKTLEQKDKNEDVSATTKSKSVCKGDKSRKESMSKAKVYHSSDSSADSCKSRSKNREKKLDSKSKRRHKQPEHHHKSRKERGFKSKVPRVSDSSTDSSRSRSKLRSNRDYSKSKRRRKQSSDRVKSRKERRPRSGSSTDSSGSISKYKRKRNDSKSKGRRKQSPNRRKSRKGCKPKSRDNSMSDTSTDSSRSRSKHNKNGSRSKRRRKFSGNCRHSKERARSDSSTDSSESQSKYKRKRDEYKTSKGDKGSSNRQKSGKYSKSKSRDKRTSCSPKERGKYKKNTDVSKLKRKRKNFHHSRNATEKIRCSHEDRRMPDSSRCILKLDNRDKRNTNESKSKRRDLDSIDDHWTYFRSHNKYTLKCKGQLYGRNKSKGRSIKKRNSKHKDRRKSDSLKENVKLITLIGSNDKGNESVSKNADRCIKEVKVDSLNESSHLNVTTTSLDTAQHPLSGDKDETLLGHESLENIQIPLEQRVCISDAKILLPEAASLSTVVDKQSKDDNGNYVYVDEKPKLESVISIETEKEVQNDIAQRALVERYVCKFLNRFVHNNFDTMTSTEASKSYKKEISRDKIKNRNRQVKRQPLLSINDQKPPCNYLVNPPCPIMYPSVLPPQMCNLNTNYINYTLQSIPLPTYTNFYPPQPPKKVHQIQQFYDFNINYPQNGITGTSYLSRNQYTEPFYNNTDINRHTPSPYQCSAAQINMKVNEMPLYRLQLSSSDLHVSETKNLNDDSNYCTRNSSTSSLINSVLDMDISSPCRSIDSIKNLKLEDNISDKDDMSSCGGFEFESQEPLDPFQKYADAPKPNYEHIINTEVHASAIGKRFEYAYLKSTFCNCVPPNPDEIRMGKSACDENCFNRKIKVECNHCCPVYDLCTNRRFQEQMYANIEPFYSGKEKGWGIRTLGKIPAWTFIIEYVGELIDFDEFLYRINENAPSNNHFLMLIQKDMYIDSGYKGNWSRFVNHSCDPNTTIERWVVNGKTRIGLFSKKPISKDEEITIDYQFQQYGSIEQICYCSSVNCTGVMGKVNEKLQEQIKTSAIRHRKELINRIISRKSLKEINHVSEMITVIKEKSLDRDTFFNFLEVLLQTKSHLCIRTFIECGGLDVITSYLDNVSWDDWPLKLLYLQCIDHFKLKKRTLLNSGSTSATVVDNWSNNPRYVPTHLLANSLNADSFNDDNEPLEDSPEPSFIDTEPLVQFSLPNSEEPISEIENQVQSLAAKIKEYFSEEREKFFIPKIKTNPNEFSNEFSANDSESRSISIASSIHTDFIQMKQKILQKKCDEVIQKLSKDEFRRLFSERYNKSLVEKNQSPVIIDSNDNDNEAPPTIKQILSNVIIKEINRLKQNDQFSAMPIEVQNLDINKLLSGLNIVEKEGMLSLSTSHKDSMSHSTSLSNYSKSSDDTSRSDQDTSLFTNERLPPNWRFCRSEDGRIYYYHSISKKTQWEAPLYPWDAGEEDPNSYDFGGAHRYRVTVDDVEYMRARYRENFKEERLREWQRKKFERSLQRKLDLSAGDINKIKFSREVFKAVKVQMKPYFSSSCKIGRVKSKQDLKFLCEKFAETIITKEVKLVANLEDLELNIDVGSKIKLYIKKYMLQQGPFYKRSKTQAVRQQVAATPAKTDSVCTPVTLA